MGVVSYRIINDMNRNINMLRDIVGEEIPVTKNKSNGLKIFCDFGFNFSVFLNFNLIL